MGIAHAVPRWIDVVRRKVAVEPESCAASADRIVARRSFGRLPMRLSHRFGVKIELGLTADPGSPETVAWEAGGAACRFRFDPALFDHSHGRVLVERWLASLPLLMSAWRDQNVRGATFLALGDCGTGEGLSFCDFRRDARLVPDPQFLGSDGYRRQKTAFRDDPLDWQAREPRAFWRGQTSGWHDAEGRPVGSWRDLPRVRLCRSGLEARDLLDVGLTGIVQVADPAAKRDIEAAGLMVAPVDWRRFSAWRYQIDIDGNSNAWEGLFVKLCSGSPVLKVESAFGFRQWYYDRLVPWLNVVPVAADGSDLLEKVAWLRAHDAAAREIGRAARSLVDAMTLQREIVLAAPTIAAALREGM